MAQLFNRNWLVGLLQGGRVLAKGQNSVILAAAGNAALDVRIPDLRSISHVVEVEWYTSGPTYALGYEKWIWSQNALGGGTDSSGTRVHEANVVGITIYQVQAGTTITVEILAIGRP